MSYENDDVDDDDDDNDDDDKSFTMDITTDY